MAPPSILRLLCFASFTSAAFNLLPPGNATLFSQFLGISAGCVTALNTTVACDSTRFGWLSAVDSYQWQAVDISTLCTTTCSSSLSSWFTAVGSACSGDTLPQTGKSVPASNVAGIYQDSYNVACLQSATGSSCMIQSQNWQGSDVIRWDLNSCNTGNATYDNPACFQGNFSLMQILPAQERLANLYNQTMLCSDCFVRMMHQRLSSPYLPDSDHSDYLVGQFSDMQSVCTTSMALTTRALPTYANTTALPTTTTSAAATATCIGQTIQPTTPALSCDQLSQQYGVTTGDLNVITGDWGCGFTSPICVPSNCTVDYIPFGQTCDTLRAQYSTASGTNITASQFSTWNPNIVGLCDRVTGNQYVCKSPPGGAYVPPIGTIVAPTATSAYYSTASASQPTSSGTTKSCGKYYNVVAGDNCNVVCLNNGISFPQLEALNIQIYNNCSNLWTGYAYCIANVTAVPISTDGTCGPGNAKFATCTGSSFGTCCSTSGFCGSTSAYCGQGNCYSGACQNATSPDGSCGPAHNYYDCAAGYCCSISGYCGNTTAYCGAGNCYNGACATDSGGPSTDGTCGPTFAGNKTCTGTQFGVCCSDSGYCGNSSSFCGVGNCYSGACTKAMKRAEVVRLWDGSDLVDGVGLNA